MRQMVFWEFYISLEALHADVHTYCETLMLHGWWEKEKMAYMPNLGNTIFPQNKTLQNISLWFLFKPTETKQETILLTQ